MSFNERLLIGSILSGLVLVAVATVLAHGQTERRINRENNKTQGRLREMEAKVHKLLNVRPSNHTHADIRPCQCKPHEWRQCHCKPGKIACRCKRSSFATKRELLKYTMRGASSIVGVARRVEALEKGVCCETRGQPCGNGCCNKKEW